MFPSSWPYTGIPNNITACLKLEESLLLYLPCENKVSGWLLLYYDISFAELLPSRCESPRTWSLDLHSDNLLIALTSDTILSKV